MSWRARENGWLTKTFLFPDFVAALAFVNRVAAVAGREGRYPELALSWGRVDVRTQDPELTPQVDEEFFRRGY